jgi:predicted O-linked N-acetylglucosamine transferase (SPINDLY family)
VAGCEHFVDADNLDYADLAAMIRRDGIDILVDLTGYTTGARPQVFALRPAPVQVQYQGFPGTLGADWLDYVVVDRIVVPDVEARFWAEKPVRMPHCYFVADHLQPIAAETPSRRDLGLPEDGFVFVSFNGYYKIEPVAFDAWMRILGAIPGSVLWLGSQALSGMDNLRREAAARGVEPDRLVFAPRVPEKADHLARLAAADLAFDTLRFNGFGTTSDVLWAGVPLLTVLGTSLATRVTASELTAVGLADLIADSVAGYEALAIALARDPARLAAVRARLAARRSSPLFDTPRWVRNLERAYRTMWMRHEAGLPPAGFDVVEP